MDTFTIILLSIIAIWAIWFIYEHRSTKREHAEITIQNRQTQWLSTYGLDHKPGYKSDFNQFVMDEDGEFVYVSSRILADSAQVFLRIPFSKIIGFETQIDNQVETRTTGTLSRALVGGMLAGGAGAIVGAASAKTVSTDKINSYKAILYLDDLTNPQFEFDLIDSPTLRTDYAYTEAQKFAGSVNASVKVILSRNEAGKAALQSAQAQTRAVPPAPKQPQLEQPKKAPRVCSVCGKKPIVAAKVNNGRQTVNAFLCESCLHTAGKIAHVKVVASVHPDYPVGYETGTIPSPEPSLDDFEFQD